MSYAEIYHRAVRESLRVELNLALNEIEEATHAVIGKWNKIVYCYGTFRVCEDFANGIERDVTMVEMTTDIKEYQKTGKVKAYRNP